MFFNVQEQRASVATGMGWLRLVGFFKLHVCFAEYSLFYRALLQKRPLLFKELTNRRHPICKLDIHTCIHGSILYVYIYIYIYVCIHKSIFKYICMFTYGERAESECCYTYVD